MRTLSPIEFKRLIEAGGATLLDVRTPAEIALAALPNAVNIPLHELSQRLDELDATRPVAVFCHHGVRSERASRLLEQCGFADVSHLAGGIDAWSAQIDPTLPRY